MLRKHRLCTCLQFLCQQLLRKLTDLGVFMSVRLKSFGGTQTNQLKNMNKNDKFLKKLWCYIGGRVQKVI